MPPMFGHTSTKFDTGSALRACGLSLLTLAVLTSCGGTEPQVRTAPAPEPFEAKTWLFELAQAEITTLRQPEQSLDELRSAIRSARGEERRQALYQMALYQYFRSGEVADAGQARVHRRAALQVIRRASRARETETLDRDLAFLNIWCSWLEGRQSVRNLIRRYQRDFNDNDELSRIVWSILGEFEAENERWSEATDAWRNLIGDSSDPLYAYALLRQGQALNASGESRQASRALRQARRYACHDDAPERVIYFGNLAAVELGDELRLTPAGQALPEPCFASENDEED